MTLVISENNFTQEKIVLNNGVMVAFGVMDYSNERVRDHA